ncbi:MAG: hypothetical protein KIC77_05655 [Clostridiales bacterium]|nr:hypothetical protein [Clostridiales bacterium]
MKKFVVKIKDFLKGKNKLIIIAVAVISLILLAPFQKIEIGQQGILYNSVSGKISTDLSSGWHLVFPFFQKMISYPTNETVYKIYRDNKNWNNGIDASIVTPTKDNQTISLDVTFIFSLDKERFVDIFKRFSGEKIEQIENDYLDDIFRASVIDSITKYTAYDVYSSKRSEVQAIVLDDLSSKLLDTGIIIKDVYIDTVRLSTETEAIIKAQSLAEAARIEAQGQSDANKLISDSLTDKIMTYEAIQKMSESLKLIIVPSGSEGQIDYSKIIEQILNETGVQQGE